MRTTCWLKGRTPADPRSNGVKNPAENRIVLKFLGGWAMLQGRRKSLFPPKVDPSLPKYGHLFGHFFPETFPKNGLGRKVCFLFVEDRPAKPWHPRLWAYTPWPRGGHGLAAGARATQHLRVCPLPQALCAGPFARPNAAQVAAGPP